MRLLRVVGLLALGVAATACTSSEDMTLLHREITDVQRQVQRLESSSLDKSDLGTMERSMQDLTTRTMRSNADLAQQVVSLQEQIEGLRASLDLTTRQLEKISQELAAARSQLRTASPLPPVTTVPQEGTGSADEGAGEPAQGGDQAGAAAAGAAATGAAAAPASGPDELYRTAYEDYMRGNYDLAAQGFREYLRRYPDTDLADNALYWVGECLDAQDLTKEALEVFSKVLEDYPNSDKAAAAQLKKGLIYLKTGDQAQGVVQLQYVVYEHPGTREADLARERLGQLGLTIR